MPCNLMATEQEVKKAKTKECPFNRLSLSETFHSVDHHKQFGSGIYLARSTFPNARVSEILGHNVGFLVDVWNCGKVFLRKLRSSPIIIVTQRFRNPTAHFFCSPFETLLQTLF
jgi:hypothetical protein